MGVVAGADNCHGRGIGPNVVHTTCCVLLKLGNLHHVCMCWSEIKILLLTEDSSMIKRRFAAEVSTFLCSLHITRASV
jgi:hypothetical protein